MTTRGVILWLNAILQFLHLNGLFLAGFCSRGQELRPLLEQNRFDAIHSFNRLKEVARCTEIALEIAGAGKLMEECRFTETLDQLLRQYLLAHGTTEEGASACGFHALPHIAMTANKRLRVPQLLTVLQ